MEVWYCILLNYFCCCSSFSRVVRGNEMGELMMDVSHKRVINCQSAELSTCLMELINKISQCHRDVSVSADGFWELCCYFCHWTLHGKKLWLGGHVPWLLLGWCRGTSCSLCWNSFLLFPGEVVLLVPMPADGPADSWQLLPDGRAASPTTSFTQQDISDGIVWYRHSGAEVESDSFQFQVFLTVSLEIPRGSSLRLLHLCLVSPRFNNNTDMCVNTCWQIHLPLIKPIIFAPSEKRSRCLFKKMMCFESPRATQPSVSKLII